MHKVLSIFYLVLILSCSTKAQDSSYVINGFLEKIKSGTMYLNIYEPGKTFNDSTPIRDGKFQFTGFVQSPSFATLTMPERHDDYFTFYAEPATMEISGRGDSLKLLKIRMKPITQWEESNS